MRRLQRACACPHPCFRTRLVLCSTSEEGIREERGVRCLILARHPALRYRTVRGLPVHPRLSRYHEDREEEATVTVVERSVESKEVVELLNVEVLTVTRLRQGTACVRLVKATGGVARRRRRRRRRPVIRAPPPAWGWGGVTGGGGTPNPE